VWTDALDADGGHRDGAGLAEITGVLPARSLGGYPAGIRVIMRRERPRPGAFEERDGWRYTDTRVGQVARLDARQRAHARVEDRVRCAKDTGLDHFPSRSFALNQAWLSVVTLAVDLIAWTQHLLLHGHLAKAEPKTLRYRLLHVAARLTRGQRRLWLRSQRTGRQPQHAGRATTSIVRNGTCQDNSHDNKIDPLSSSMTGANANQARPLPARPHRNRRSPAPAPRPRILESRDLAAPGIGRTTYRFRHLSAAAAVRCFTGHAPCP
jgi:hypothetical protein